MFGRFRRSATIAGAMFSLSSFSMPPLNTSTTLLNQSLPKEPATPNTLLIIPAEEMQAISLDREQIQTEIKKSSLSKGGIVVDSHGAAWTGEEKRLLDKMSMSAILPSDPTIGKGFHRFVYFGLNTHIKKAGKRYRRNSDVGISINSKNGSALPFILSTDTSLDMAKATVTVIDLHNPEKPKIIRGRLDNKGRYYSFRISSKLRKYVTFHPGDNLFISITRWSSSSNQDGLSLEVQNLDKTVKIHIPIHKSYNSRPRTISAHKVVSAVHEEGYAPSACLKTASLLISSSDLSSFPTANRLRLRQIARVTSQATQAQLSIKPLIR